MKVDSGGNIGHSGSTEHINVREHRRHAYCTLQYRETGPTKVTTQC